MRNLSKKRNIILIAVITIMIIAFIYFVPRLLVVIYMKNLHGEFEELKEIELPEKKNLLCEEFEYKGINMSIPIHDKDYEKFIVEQDDTPAHIRGYKYDITLWLNDGQDYFKNFPVDSSLSKHYLNAKTRYEYEIKCLDITEKDLKIFQPLSSLRNNYSGYETKNRLTVYGNTYTAFQRYRYFYVVVLDNKVDDKDIYNWLHIEIYDTQKSYELIGFIQILKFDMNLDDVSFIAKSIRIDREEE